jgi:NAD(P)-dependent dehydrogenase (short-subunit alcohol dehydrogenase family)
MHATQAGLKIMTRRGRGAIVNIASTAGLGFEAYGSPEYAAAKAGLIRFSSCFANQGLVRVNCIVPGWLATERALAELEAMSERERQLAEEPTPMTAVAAAVIQLLLTDGRAMGRALLLEGTKPPRYLGIETR